MDFVGNWSSWVGLSLRRNCWKTTRRNRRRRSRKSYQGLNQLTLHSHLWPTN
jgi:hypothetical protein